MFSPQRLAIDLGTANAVVYLFGKGIILAEPTVVAINTQANKIVATGSHAKQMLGKTPKGLFACRPLREGSITHYRATEALLRKFLAAAKKHARFNLGKPEVIISVPAGLTSVEERAVMQALASAGAGQIYILPEPIAAAIGAGLPIHTSAANMIVNLGGGTAEIAVISMNGIITATSHRGAGDALNREIIEYLRQNRHLEIGENEAEQIKWNLANVYNPHESSMNVSGVHIKSGLPTTMVVTSQELLEPIKNVVRQIVHAISKSLSQLPAELAADIVERGIVMSGGTALLGGLDEFLTKALNIPFHVVDEPLLCVSRGLVYALEHLEEFTQYTKQRK
jgi:rod shape-determining protein MreB